RPGWRRNGLSGCRRTSPHAPKVHKVVVVVTPRRDLMAAKLAVIGAITRPMFHELPAERHRRALAAMREMALVGADLVDRQPEEIEFQYGLRQRRDVIHFRPQART